MGAIIAEIIYSGGRYVMFNAVDAADVREVFVGRCGVDPGCVS